MDALIEKINKWYELKKEYEIRLFKFSLNSKKQEIQQNILLNNEILALTQYNCIWEHLSDDENNNIIHFMVERLKWNFRNNRDEVVEKMLLVVAKSDNRKLFPRFRSVFAENIVQLSLKIAEEPMVEIVKILTKMHLKFDIEDFYGMKNVVENICLEKINQFNKFGEYMLNSGLELKKYDKWLSDYEKFISLKSGLEYDEIKGTYEKMEMLYYETCFNNVIVKDVKNGPEDLIFLLEKIVARINIVGTEELKTKIIEKALNSGILNKNKKNEIVSRFKIGKDENYH